MPRLITETKEVFKFSELSESVKSDAIIKFYSDGDFDLDFVFDDAIQIAEILGFEFTYNNSKPNIFYSGFNSQGDGASFAGYYSYAAKCKDRIRAYAPQDTELHRIADCLVKLAKRTFYKVSAKIYQNGRYLHSNTMNADFEGISDSIRDDIESEMLQLFRDFADWIYRQLEKEYDYIMSDESFTELCEANGYEFDSAGALI